MTPSKRWTPADAAAVPRPPRGFASSRVSGSRAPAAWKSRLALAGSVVLGAVLLAAAWTKVIDPEAFARQIESEGLDILLPVPTLASVAISLEVLLGTLLLLVVRRLPVLLAASGLTGPFLFLTGRTWWLVSRGELPADVGCGCFGNLVVRTPAEAFLQDLLLLVPALLLAWCARPSGAAFPR